MRGIDFMKINELKELMSIIEHSSIDVLKIEKQDFKLYYQKQNASNIKIDFEVQDTPVANSEEMIIETHHIAGQEDNDFHQIKSPMIGAFYSRSNPDAEPLVQIGSVIKINQPVCILEAMKLLNEVVSDVDGEIIDILVEDGQIIDYGQPLFVVKVSV
jgi:acetyl-CoA carboxylase biotin carboxyl carrier protein